MTPMRRYSMRSRRCYPRGKGGVLGGSRLCRYGLLAQLRRLGWHFRIRIKATFTALRPGQPACKVDDFALAPGRALFLQNVAITAEQFGPVSLALARHSRNGEYWYIVSDEPTSVYTFEEYGRRFRLKRTSWTINPTAFSSKARSCAMPTPSPASAWSWRSRLSIWWRKGRRSSRSRNGAGWIRTGCAGTRTCASGGSGSKPRWRAAGSCLPRCA